MSSYTLNLTPEIYDYLLCNILPLSEPAKRLRHVTEESTNASVMQISAEQGGFMALLMKILGAKQTIEVGTFTGYSALVVAEALPDDGRVVACDISQEWTSIGKPYWVEAGVDHKIELHIRPATETLRELIDKGEKGTFDFAFIDADKPNYNTYYELCYQLLRQGGIIAVDNVLWGGRAADPRANDPSTTSIRSVNEKIRKDSRVEATMLPIGDGLTLAVKK